MTPLPYPGHIPSNVAKDAKYSVVSGPNGGMEIRLVYRLSSSERELLTTDRHDPLVEMVNDVKLQKNARAGGVFYVNEYYDVLVPTEGGCFYAGNYPHLLEFAFEGRVIGPTAPDDLQPGEPWSGPHVGIRYVLTADGVDIKYESHVTATRIRTERLSDHVGQPAARRLAARLGSHKGVGGGRVYINEASEFFAPVSNGARVDYLYLGHLDEDLWFPAPDVPR